MKPILFVSNVRRRFVELDETILRERYPVQSVYYERAHPSLIVDAFAKTQNIQLVFAWFASWHTLPVFTAARLRGIPTILITGGYDVANEPQINYGLRQGGISKIISGQVFRLAERTLAFSDYGYREALANTPVKKERLTAINLGVPDLPEYGAKINKEAMVITIGHIDRVSMPRKGFLTFVKAAQYLPDTRFIVIGKARDTAIDELKAIAAPNVEFTGYLSDEDMVKLQQRAKVYVQVSHHEGFGLSVVESMLARCIPVVSRRGALPDVVGPTGLYVDDYTDEQALAQAIEQALQMPDSQGELAREYALEHFSIQQRAKALYQEIDRLIAIP